VLVVVNTGIKERWDGANVGASKFRVVGSKLIDGVPGVARDMIAGKVFLPSLPKFDAPEHALVGKAIVRRWK
jgi:hypothetical protein